MSKEEFLKSLKGKITGKMPAQEVESQLDYYSAYIDGEMGKGRSEEEIISEIGDPLLISKTLIGAMGRAREAAGNMPEYTEDESSYTEAGNYDEETEERAKGPRAVRMGGAGCIAAIIIALIIIIGIIILLVKFSITIFRFLWPVILVLVVAGIIVGLVRRR